MELINHLPTDLEVVCRPCQDSWKNGVGFVLGGGSQGRLSSISDVSHGKMAAANLLSLVQNSRLVVQFDFFGKFETAFQNSTI
jgi:hypothetical protein